jgi:hypothetical protein
VRGTLPHRILQACQAYWRADLIGANGLEAAQEALGRYIWDSWIEWATMHPDAMPGYFIPWEELDANRRALVMEIGRPLFEAGWRFDRD